MSIETKPSINVAPTATVEDLISHLQSTFFSADFQKIAKILAEREKNLKRASTEAEKWRKEYLLAQKNHADLLLKHLIVEEELNKWKIECQATKEKVIALQEENNVLVEREKRREERYAKLLNEFKEFDEKARVLCIGKDRADAEAEIWKNRYKELGVRLSRLEGEAEVVLRRNPLLKDEIEETTGKRVSRSSKFYNEINAASANGISFESERKIMLMSPEAGSTTCVSRKMKCIGSQEGGGKQLQSGEVIEIDTDDEEPARSASFVNIRASDLKTGEKKMSPQMVNLEGSGQTVMENAGSQTGNSLLASNSKRKRDSVIKSEVYSSGDDSTPIGRLKKKVLWKFDSLPQA